MSLLQRSFSYFFITTIALLGFFFLAGPVSAATITVTSINADADAMDGECNFEEAINNINAGLDQEADCVANLDNLYGTEDTILFNVNGGGPVTITGSTSPLSISSPVIIDGLSQDDLATCGTEDHMGDRALYVTLDGFRIQILSDDVIVFGLVFAHDNNPLAFSQGDGHHVFCNNFGFDGDGQDTLGVDERDTLLRVTDVDGIEIGDENPALGNMFAGNTSEASQTLPVWNSSNVTIQGNRFGVGGGEDPDVLGAVGSHITVELIDDGNFIIVTESKENILIQNNYLYDSGGEASAINIRIGEEDEFGIDDVQILDNIILFSEIIFDTNGIEVTDNITNLVIDGNIIQNFSASGIDLQGMEGVILTNNTIESSSEDSFGITLGSVRDVIVGTPGNGNTIHTFSPAIELTPRGGDNVTDHVIIQGNTFTSIDAPVVQAIFSVENVLIGGTQAGEGNNLNGLVGVMIFYTSAAEEEEPALTIDNIAILGNTIDAEGGIAWLIDTDGDFNPEYTEGLISNDTLDTLSVLGPNRLIHTPEIISTTDNGDDTFTVTYEIDVDAGEYRMEWYRDAEVSNADSGIGNEFLDSVDIIHAGNGPETFTIILPVALDDILAVTLTEIIDPGTNDWNFGATSQFSEQFVVALAVEEQPTPTRRSSGSSTSQSRALAQKVFADHYANTGETTETPALCPVDQIITQNLRAPSRNGVYNSYTGGIVLEIDILQTHLNRLGFNSGPVDGIAGPLTDGAIKRMQTVLGTPADGYVGPLTRALLNTSCSSQGLQTN